MSLDMHDPGLITLEDAAKLLPRVGGKTPHYATLARWCKKGVNGVRLDHVRLGYRILTTSDALDRFFSELTSAGSGVEDVAEMETASP